MMLETASQHFVYIEPPPPRDRIFHGYDQQLNVSRLLALPKFVNAASTTQGKKRAAAEKDQEHNAKKAKRTTSNPDSEVEIVQDSTRSPVFRHIAENEYSFGDAGLFTEAENKDNETLLSTINSLATGLPDCKSIDLGDVQFRFRAQRIVGGQQQIEVFSREVVNNASPWKKEEHLLLLPVIHDQAVDLDAMDYTSGSSVLTDLVLTSLLLANEGKATISAELQLLVMPSTGETDKVKLRITTSVALLAPGLFNANMSNVKRTKKQQNEIEDAQRRLLTTLYPLVPLNFEAPEEAEHGETTIHSFYSVLGPAPSLLTAAIEEYMQPKQLLPKLLPFQRRSVAWMLAREGKTVDSEGKVIPASDVNSSLPLFYSRIDDPNVSLKPFYINRLTGIASPSLPETYHEHSPALGGILAEEPGLGKTVETISLILLNPAPAQRTPDVIRWDEVGKLDIRQVKATLVVTPPSLIQQWADEIKRHAPTLKILIYEGWDKLKVPITEENAEEARVNRRKALPKKGKGKAPAKPTKATKGKAKAKAKVNVDSENGDAMDVDEQPILSWCYYAHQFDIILVTYAILRHDFNVAKPAPKRPRREDVVYSNVDRPRSPLIMCEWNRVVMDEVQLCGGGNTEDMVSLIPRVSSFAVSGTPAKTQVSDLIHVLKFLRVDNLVGSKLLWNRLLRPHFSDLFASFFRKYAIRTTKRHVKDELTIPTQTRYLVPVEMGRVERHIYDEAFETGLDDLGLDVRGVAASEGWQVDGALLRTTLRKLRGICTHPQVGQMLKAANDKKIKNLTTNTLKTMTDVLQAMNDNNWKNLMEDWKAKIQLMIRLAQLLQKDNTKGQRHRLALDALKLAEPEAEALIQEVRDVIKAHDAKGEVLKAEARANGGNGKGKEKEREDSYESDDESEDFDDENRGLPKTPAGKAHGYHATGLRNRLRDCRVVLHRIKFLQGDAYSSLGPAHAANEEEAYAVAEEIRRDLLKMTENTAKRAMNHLSNTDGEISENDLLVDLPFLEPGGIRSSVEMEEANDIIDEVLNEQSSLIWEWRVKIRELLTQSLTANDEADGLEYQRTLDSQGEVETYIQVYAALLADRRQALLNERTLLATHDAREKKLRHTKAAMKAAAALDQDEDDLLDHGDIELQPEHELLRKELTDNRKGILDVLGARAIKTVLANLNSVVNRIHGEKDVEKVLIMGAIKSLRAFIKEQGQIMDQLDDDLASVRRAFNERILYFRQLQEISDSVAEVTWEEHASLNDAIVDCRAERQTLEDKILTIRARQRFLGNLATASAKGEDQEEEDRTCILCRCDFNRGFLTNCAHVFCEGCMKEWLNRKEGKTCPVCRSPIDFDMLQRFTVDEQVGAPLPPKLINNEPAPVSRRQIQYNVIDKDVFKRIQNIEMDGDYSMKVQTLIQHLLYIQSTEPGSKSIIFSAWADSLHIIEHALKTNGIQSLRIENSTKGQSAAQKFRLQPDYLVLLLHGERENAGLNVTCASRVFLVESVVHHGFELQAIARIDRMGQTKGTEVYCYYAEDTVERNILDLAARKGLSLYTSDNSAGTLNTSSFDQETEDKVVDAPTKKNAVQKGDFIYKLDTMLAILFPTMFEDIEFLIPGMEEHDGMDVDVHMQAGSSTHRRVQQVNADAGPSRLG